MTSVPPTEPEREEEEEKAKREKRDARVVDENLKMIGLYVADVSDSPTESRRLSPGRVSVQSWTGRQMDWSPDGSTIVFVHQPSPKVNDWPKADLSAVDVATGRVRALASTGSAEGSPHFSPDGRWIAFLRGRPEAGEKMGLYLIPLLAEGSGNWRRSSWRIFRLDNTFCIQSYMGIPNRNYRWYIRVFPRP